MVKPEGDDSDMVISASSCARVQLGAMVLQRSCDDAGGLCKCWTERGRYMRGHDARHGGCLCSAHAACCTASLRACKGHQSVGEGWHSVARRAR